MLSLSPKDDLNVWRLFSGTSGIFGISRKRQKYSPCAPKLIWSCLEIVFGDFRAFLGFPEKAKRLSVGPKVGLEWSGDRFRGLRAFLGFC